VVPVTRKATGKLERKNMKNTTIGVDPLGNFTSDGPLSVYVNTTAAEVPTGNSAPSLPAAMRTPAENEIYGYIHSSNAQYFMGRLLGNVLSLVDASIPNKDQNKATKHLTRKAFDSALMDIHNMAWPSLGDPTKDKQSAAMTGSAIQIGNGYILQPES
jgi:hypothetical protein